ncbi:ATP-dependent DNA ligase [Syncephalastrum racemosum]|uniref:DNA ligase n=1 Tax=Syncephalastrum racemosum TaxID=13706 RepID=A0A1X2HCX8_SYNRA|nr:ATP-dependent DNA ligase [Syncephalastrum racemosum]
MDAGSPDNNAETSEQDVDMEIKEAEKEEEEEREEMKAERAATKQLVPYAALVKTFEKCEQTTKRLEITEHLVMLFIQLCPDYEGLELGIGESIIMRAIGDSTGRKPDAIKKSYQKIGDLGTVAQESKRSQSTLFPAAALTVPHVFKKLKEIAMFEGQSSQARKIKIIQNLLVACKGNEAKYIIRQLEGKLRIGLAEQTVLAALAQAVVLSDPKSKKWSTGTREERLLRAAEVVKSVYNQLPSYDMIIPALLEHPLEELLDHCTMRPGIPLKPMLAHPTKSLTEVLDRFEGQNFTCEYKYDGERAQIHKLEDGTISIYSRNSENMSQRYPDVMEKIQKWIKPSTTSFIIDCETVAWDKEKKRILPFQVLSTRKRKDVKEEDIKVQVAIFAFDCLYLNGESLLQTSLKTRRQKMMESFIRTEDEFFFAESMDSNNIEDIQHFLDESIKNNCEGLMVKLYDNEHATYEPSKRSRNWLKVKKDYLAGVGDSVDLVVIGAFHGKGKRTAVYGAFLLACYDPETEKFQTVCKIGTGFSEEQLKTFHEKLKDTVIPTPRSDFMLGENPIKPDVWFKPTQVWEVQPADLSVSPVYMAGVGQVDPTKGISLRFPRFLKIREDKEVEDATSSDQIVEFYLNQGRND